MPRMRSRFVIALSAAAAAASVAAVDFAAGGSAASLPSVQTQCTAKSAQVKPKRILIACGDGNFYITGLKWSTWSSTGARGKGTAHLNDCKPFCAAGHFHSYRGITVRLSRPKTCKGAPEFRRLSWRYGAKRPAGIRRGGFTTFPCVG
jgi:hypothetical protein